MKLTEENYIEQINAFNEKDWKPLLELIPEIERTTDFGQISGLEKDEKGVFQLPYWLPSSVVDCFHDLVYDMQLVIDFKWGAWDEGRRMIEDKTFNWDSIDIPTKCKVVTYIVRSDRFCDGSLVSAFKSGLILKLLISIQNQLNADRR